jgi:thymidylate kinase
MKLIIIEGPDNCGKNTLINKISENFLTITNIHYTKPENKYIQNTVFRGYAYAIVNKVYDTDAVILNRSHYGEYVYGCLYRGISDKDALDIINEIDDIYLKYNIDVYYIQLLSTSDKLLVKNDDNKSLSKGNIEAISAEQRRFKSVYDKSKLNKILIYVNDGENFRSPNDIYNEAINFINKK